MKKIIISLVRGYQFVLSPWLGQSCRFTPTCSHYMIEAVERFGVFRGCGLGIWRIMRCHPFCDGGHDPVPPSSNLKDKEL